MEETIKSTKMVAAKTVEPWLNESLAPNGSKIVDNFNAWFGTSKVLAYTPEGQIPLVVYHGTAADFRSFDPKAVGSAHVDLEEGEVYFFSSDRKTAKWYADDCAKDEQSPGRIVPVYLSLQNPRIVDFGGTGLEGLGEEVQTARAKGHDGLICREYDDGGVSSHYLAFSAYQIKSAMANSGLYAMNDRDISDGAVDQDIHEPSAKPKSAACKRMTP